MLAKRWARPSQAMVFVLALVGTAVSVGWNMRRIAEQSYFTNQDITEILRTIPTLGSDWNHSLILPIMRAVAGLDPARWVWCIGAMHLINGALLVFVTRKIGLGKLTAATVGLVYVGCPATMEALSVEYVIEMALVLGYLLVTIGYMGRATARTHRGSRWWLLIEVVGLLVGVMEAKSSFVVYLGIIVAIELTLFHRTGTMFSGIRIPLMRRLRPHLYVGPIVALMCIGGIQSEVNAGKLGSLLPWDIAGRLGFFVGASAAPFGNSSSAITATGAVFLTLLAFGYLWRKQHRSVLAFGLLLIGVMSLPVLVLRATDVGYVHQVWPGIAFCGALLASTATHRLDRALAVLWLGTLFCTTPYLMRSDNRPDISESTLAAIRAESSDFCADKPVHWRAPPQVWTWLDPTRSESHVAE